MQNVLVRLKKIRFFKGDIQSGSSFHISIGHNTVQATMTLFVDKTKEGMYWLYKDGWVGGMKRCDIRLFEIIGWYMQKYGFAHLCVEIVHSE